jgi:hypothetical protein
LAVFRSSNILANYNFPLIAALEVFMVNPDNKIEKYAFLRLYEHDFEMALQTAQVLDVHENNNVRFPLLRDIVVTYCRPFTESNGIGINKDFHGVKKFPNEEMKSLHAKLLTLRKELFAHTDLTYKNPKISNWSTDERKWFPMSFKGYDYAQLNTELPNIVKLINFVLMDLKEKLAVYEQNL